MTAPSFEMNTNYETKRRWRDVQRQVPMALVFGFLLQTGGVLFWAGVSAERIAEVERQTRANSSAIERIVRLETQVVAMHETLTRIEGKLDRMRVGPNK